MKSKGQLSIVKKVIKHGKKSCFTYRDSVTFLVNITTSLLSFANIKNSRAIFKTRLKQNTLQKNRTFLRKYKKLDSHTSIA